MIRIVTLAAATALIALPVSAQSVRVSTVGKSPEQVRAEVFKVARGLCAREVVGASFPVDQLRACVDGTMRATLAQVNDPALKFAQR
jgi:hypothetical protein